MSIQIWTEQGMVWLENGLEKELEVAKNEADVPKIEIGGEFVTLLCVGPLASVLECSNDFGWLIALMIALETSLSIA